MRTKNFWKGTLKISCVRTFKQCCVILKEKATCRRHTEWHTHKKNSGKNLTNVKKQGGAPFIPTEFFSMLWGLSLKTPPCIFLLRSVIIFKSTTCLEAKEREKCSTVLAQHCHYLLRIPNLHTTTIILSANTVL